MAARDPQLCPLHEEITKQCDRRHEQQDHLNDKIFLSLDEIKGKAEDNRIEAIRSASIISMRMAKIVGAGVVVQIIAAAFLLALFTKWIK